MNNSFKIKPLNAMFIIIMILSIIGLLSVASWALRLMVNTIAEDLNSSKSSMTIQELDKLCINGVLYKKVLDENSSSLNFLLDKKCGV